MSIFLQRKIVKYCGKIQIKKNSLSPLAKINRYMLVKDNSTSLVVFKSVKKVPKTPKKLSTALDNQLQYPFRFIRPLPFTQRKANQHSDLRQRLVKCLVTKNTTAPFFNFTFDKGRLKNLVSWTLENYGQYKTVELLEQLKKTGFEYATKAGISLGLDDLKIPPKKKILLLEAEQLTKLTIHQYQRGDITAVERFQRLIDTWHRTSEQLKQEVINHFEETDILNPVYMMAFSGARGNISQVRQLVGMRGLMSDPQGQIIDFPIQSNFREGLTLTEYIISSYGARKGIVDTALRTANAGYLTRRLVDVAQHVIISHYDCGTHKGIFLTDMKEGNKTIVSAQSRIIGRVLARDIYKPNSLIKIAKRNQEISTDVAFEIGKVTNRVFVRSSLTCNTTKLLCQLCYGWSLAQGNLVSVGEAVGVIAAQSIGEPGTQLTMRTFHTGGVFSGDVSDEIRAPYNGFVYYENKMPGILIRTLDGKILFLTKSDGTLIFTADPNFNKPLSVMTISEKEKTSYEIKKYKIPAYTLLFIRNGESVLQKQVLAQITMISTKPNMRDTAELVIKSELEGLFYAKNLQVQKKILGPKPKFVGEGKQNVLLDPKAMEIIVKARGWNFAWVLSGKRYEFPLLLKSFASSGDLITSNTIMAKNYLQLSSPFLNVGTSLQVANSTTITKLPLPGRTSSFRGLASVTSNSILHKYTKKVNHSDKQSVFNSQVQQHQLNFPNSMMDSYGATTKSKNSKFNFFKKLNLAQFFKQYNLKSKTKTKLGFYSLVQSPSFRTHELNLFKANHLQSKQLALPSFVNKETTKLMNKIPLRVTNVQLQQSLLFLTIKKIKFHKIGYFQLVNPTKTVLLLSQVKLSSPKMNGLPRYNMQFNYHNSYNDMILLPTSLNVDISSKNQIALKRFKPAYNLFQWFYPSEIKANVNEEPLWVARANKFALASSQEANKFHHLTVKQGEFLNSFGQMNFTSRYSKMDFIKLLHNPFKLNLRKTSNQPCWVSKYYKEVPSAEISNSVQNQVNVSVHTGSTISEGIPEKNPNNTNMYQFFLKQQIFKSYKKFYKKYKLTSMFKAHPSDKMSLFANSVFQYEGKENSFVGLKKELKNFNSSKYLKHNQYAVRPLVYKQEKMLHTLVFKKWFKSHLVNFNNSIPNGEKMHKGSTPIFTSSLLARQRKLSKFNRLLKIDNYIKQLTYLKTSKMSHIKHSLNSLHVDSNVKLVNTFNKKHSFIQMYNCNPLQVTKAKVKVPFTGYYNSPQVGKEAHSVKTSSTINTTQPNFTFFQYFKLKLQQSGTKAILKHFKSVKGLKTGKLLLSKVLNKGFTNLYISPSAKQALYFKTKTETNLKLLKLVLEKFYKHKEFGTLLAKNLKILNKKVTLTKNHVNFLLYSYNKLSLHHKNPNNVLTDMLIKTNKIKLAYPYLVPTEKITTSSAIKVSSDKGLTPTTNKNSLPFYGANSSKNRPVTKSYPQAVRKLSRKNNKNNMTKMTKIFNQLKLEIQFVIILLNPYQFGEHLQQMPLNPLSSSSEFNSNFKMSKVTLLTNPIWVNQFQSKSVKELANKVSNPRHNVLQENYIVLLLSNCRPYGVYHYPEGIFKFLKIKSEKGNAQLPVNPQGKPSSSDNKTIVFDLEKLQRILLTEHYKTNLRWVKNKKPRFLPKDMDINTLEVDLNSIKQKNKLNNLTSLGLNTTPQSELAHSLAEFVKTIKINPSRLFKVDNNILNPVISTENHQSGLKVSNKFSLQINKLLKVISKIKDQSSLRQTQFINFKGAFKTSLFNRYSGESARSVFIITNKVDQFMAKQKKDPLLLPKNSTINVLIKPQKEKNSFNQTIFPLGGNAASNYPGLLSPNLNLTYLKKNIYFTQMPFFDSPFRKTTYLFSYTEKSIRPLTKVDFSYSSQQKNCISISQNARKTHLPFKVLNIPKQACLNICFKSNSNVILNAKTTNSLFMTKINPKHTINLAESLNLTKLKVNLFSSKTYTKSKFNTMLGAKLFKGHSTLRSGLNHKNVVTQTNYFSPFEGELLYTKTYKNYLDLNPYQSLKIGLMQLNTSSTASTLLHETKRASHKSSKRSIKLTEGESSVGVGSTIQQTGKNKNKTEKMRMAMFKYYLKTINSQQIIGNKGWSRFNLILTKKDLITLKYNNTLYPHFTIFSEIQKHTQPGMPIVKPIRSLSYDEVCLNYLFSEEIKNTVKLQTLAKLNKEIHFNKSYHFNLKTLWLKQKSVTTVSTSKEEGLPTTFSIHKAQSLFYKIKIFLSGNAVNLEHCSWNHNSSLQQTLGYKNLIIQTNHELFVLPSNLNFNLKWINYKQKNLFTKNKVGFFVLKGNTFFNTSQKFFNNKITKQTSFLNATIYNFGCHCNHNLVSNNNFLENTHFVDLSLCLELQKIYLNKNYLNLKPILDKTLNRQTPTEVVFKKTGFSKKQNYYLQFLNTKNNIKYLFPNGFESNHRRHSKKMYNFPSSSSYYFLKPLNMNCAHYIKQEIIMYNDLITNFKSLNLYLSFKQGLKSLSVFFINNLKMFINSQQCKLHVLDGENLFQVIKKSGQLVQMNKEKITVRLGQPLVISPRSTIHATHGDFIRYKTPVITLTYQQLKTGDIVQGIPKIEQLFEARTTKRGRLFRDNVTNLLTGLFLKYFIKSTYLLRKTMIGFSKNRWKKTIKYSLPANKQNNLPLRVSKLPQVNTPINSAIPNELLQQTENKIYRNKRLNYSQFVNNKQNQTIILALALQWAVKQSFYKIQQIIVDGILRVYRSQGVSIADKHVEIVVKQMTSKVRIINSNASKMSEYMFSLDTIKAGEIPEADSPEEEVLVQQNKSGSKPTVATQKGKKRKKGLISTKLAQAEAVTTERTQGISSIKMRHNKPKSTRKNVSLAESDLKKRKTLSNKTKPIQISQAFEQKVLNQLLSNNLDGPTGLFPGEIVDIDFVENINTFLLKTSSIDRASRAALSTDPLNPNNQIAFALEPIKYEPIVLGITRASLEVESFLSAASFQQTTRVLSQAALYKKKDFLKGLKENIIIGNLIPAGTGFLSSLNI